MNQIQIVSDPCDGFGTLFKMTISLSDKPIRELIGCADVEIDAI